MDVFTIFKQSIEPNLKKGLLEGRYGVEAANLVNEKFEEKDYESNLKKYVKSIAKQVTLKMLSLKKVESFKPALRHIELCLIALDTGRVFGKKEFNFNAFYDSFSSRSAEEYLLRI